MKSIPGETNLTKDDHTCSPIHFIGKTFITLAVLLFSGSLLNPLEKKLWGSVEENILPSNINSSAANASEGLVLATLGGFRSIFADIQWLQTMVSWENEEKEKTIANIQFTLALDPRPIFFWLNGARMIAYDMRHWESENFSYNERHEEESRLAKLAIEFLLLAKAYHPDNVSIPIEIAHIYLNRLSDFETAAEYYHKAYTEYEDAPYYVGRLYAQILSHIGKFQEAYQFLITIYRELPSEDFYSHKPIVLSRIRDLEKILGISIKDRFKP